MIIILILLIIALLLILLYINKKEDFNQDNNVPLNIGNYLSDYFFNLGKAIINNDIFTYKKEDYIFFKDLPIEIKNNDYTEWSEVYNCFIKNNINNNFFINIDPNGAWECINKSKETFWKCMHPLIQRILNEAFIKNSLKKDTKEIIIHFRCADVPFVRHNAYHFQKYNYFRDALKEINNKLNIKNVIILYNNNHLSNEKNKNACDIYVNELKKEIIDYGYNVNINSYSNIDDFAMMFYAPAVISTHSSFSFMSGFFGMGKFISAGHFYENDDYIEECYDCESWLYKGYDLYHKNVIDYYNTETVIKQLNEGFENTLKITLVSCFYLLKNKHNNDNYIKWMKNLFSIVNNFNLVIYTNEESYNIFKDFINNKKIRVVMKNIEDFYLYKYKDKWINNHKNNNGLNNIIDWKVNLLWHEKIFFVKDTIDKKYFDTPLYGWCDIGYFRNDKSDMNNYKNWPSNDKLLDYMITSNKMHIGNVQNSQDIYNNYKNEIINHYNKKLKTPPLSDIEQVSISGGFYILTSKIINQICKLFEDKIKYYFDNNYYIKHDQNIYLDMIIMNQDLFQLYYENNGYDNWFMFQRILS